MIVRKFLKKEKPVGYQGSVPDSKQITDHLHLEIKHCSKYGEKLIDKKDHTYCREDLHEVEELLKNVEIQLLENGGSATPKIDTPLTDGMILCSNGGKVSPHTKTSTDLNTMYNHSISVTGNPHVVTKGDLNLDTDDDVEFEDVKISEDLIHTGSNIGFYGKTPVVQPSTYAAASGSSAIVPALTATNMTAITGGTGSASTVFETVGDTSAGDESSKINNNFQDIKAQLDIQIAWNTALQSKVDDLITQLNLNRTDTEAAG